MLPGQVQGNELVAVAVKQAGPCFPWPKGVGNGRPALRRKALMAPWGRS